MITLSGISRAAFGGRFGATAGMIANLITTAGYTTTFALSNSGWAKEKGGARAEATTPPPFPLSLFSSATLGMRIEVGPGLLGNAPGGVAQSVETALAHELGHALQDMYGMRLGAPGVGSMNSSYRHLVNPYEAFGMAAENNYRKEAGLPIRTYYRFGPEADYGNDYQAP